MNALDELGSATPPAQTPAAQPPFDLSSVPALKAVAEADVPGFLASDEDLKRPELAPAVANYKSLAAAGLSLYRATSTPAIAVFNPEVFSAEEIQQYDAEGKLAQLLPPVSQLLEATPAAKGGGDKAGIESVPAVSPAPSAAPAPASPTPIVKARANAAAMPNKQPTRRPMPGSGSINQGLGKPVI